MIARCTVCTLYTVHSLYQYIKWIYTDLEPNRELKMTNNFISESIYKQTNKKIKKK